MRINQKMLAAHPPRPLGTLPPWTLASTELAARFLGCHPKTILAWSRAGLFVQPVSKGEINPRFFWLNGDQLKTGNRFWWILGHLRVWWERLCVPPGAARS